MDEEPPSQAISERGKRALRVITVATIAIMAASIAWLYPAMASKSNSVSPQRTPWSLTTPTDYVKYQFMNESVGWAVGLAVGSSNNGRFWVARTVDGAKHWETQLRGKVNTGLGPGSSMQFFDKAHGFVAVGVPVEVHRTADGGENWKTVQLPDEQGAVATFSDARHGWLLAGLSASQMAPNRLYATDDAGDTWRRLPDPPILTSTMAFRSPLEGWVWTRGGSVIYLSRDGGQSWQRRDVPEPPGRAQEQTVVVVALRLLPGVGVVATVAFSDGRAVQGFEDFTSFDHGATWTKVVHPQSEGSFMWESFEDATHWWGLDEGNLYKSADAGQTWRVVLAKMENGQNWRYDIQVVDSNHAWAQVMMRQVSGLMMTSDGGLHWTRANAPSPVP